MACGSRGVVEFSPELTAVACTIGSCGVFFSVGRTCVVVAEFVVVALSVGAVFCVAEVVVNVVALSVGTVFFVPDVVDVVALSGTAFFVTDDVVALSVGSAFFVAEFVDVRLSGVVSLTREALLVGDSVVGILLASVVAPWAIGSVSTVLVVALAVVAIGLVGELMIAGGPVFEMFRVAVTGL